MPLQTLSELLIIAIIIGHFGVVSKVGIILDCRRKSKQTFRVPVASPTAVASGLNFALSSCAQGILQYQRARRTGQRRWLWYMFVENN